MTTNQSQKMQNWIPILMNFIQKLKRMLWRKVKTAKWCLLSNLKQGKATIAYNSDDSDKEKAKTQKKNTFENDIDVTIPESVSKLNKIVSYKNTDSDSQKFVIYAFLFVPRLDLFCVLYFLSINSDLQMLTFDARFCFLLSKKLA